MNDDGLPGWSVALRGWRRELGLGRAAAAVALGISMRTLENWEQGRPVKQWATIQALMREVRNSRGKKMRKCKQLAVDKTTLAA